MAWRCNTFGSYLRARYGTVVPKINVDAVPLLAVIRSSLIYPGRDTHYPLQGEGPIGPSP
jgi:hypothetical protein